MAIIDQLPLALQAYQELQDELPQEPNPVPAPSVPDLEQVMAALGPLPRESLFLGMAADGLPILLDLYDPTPGPLMVMADGGSGKTALLQTLARAADLSQDPGDVQFGVITKFPEEWTALESLPNALGIWPADHSSARDFLLSLTSWAEQFHRSRQVVLLLLDGLDCMTEAGFEAEQDLRWLLTNGPERRIWPIATVNAGCAAQFAAWLGFFRSRIYGQIKQTGLAQSLANDPSADLSALCPRIQFSLQQQPNWLHFWIPALWKDERSES